MISTLRSPNPLPLRPALQPCLNKIRLDEISSNVQIKPNQISLHEKEKNIRSSVSLTRRTKSSNAFSILPSQEEDSIKFSKEQQSF